MNPEKPHPMNLTRPLPHSDEAERAVLGSLMLDATATAKVDQAIPPDAFYNQNHQLIYRTIARMVLDHEPIDLVTLTGRLRANGQLERVGGAAALTAISNTVPTAANVIFWVEQLRRLHVRRSAITTAAQLATDAYECPDEKLDGVLTGSASALQAIDHPRAAKILSMAELEIGYADFCAKSKQTSLSFSKWLPTLGRHVRPMVPGELVVFIADTGVGKTALLQSLAMAASPLTTLFCELELPGTLLYERFAQMALGMTGDDVERSYTAGHSLGGKAQRALGHIYTCAMSKMSVADVEDAIESAESRIGKRPSVVVVDYIGLLQGYGKRYEKTSDNAEQLKVVAKATNTIVVCASQVHRNKESDGAEVSLHDARDSGSIEASAGLLIGVWRDENDSQIMHFKVLKNTKGKAGFQFCAVFDGARMRIFEQTRPEEDAAFEAHAAHARNEPAAEKVVP